MTQDLQAVRDDLAFIKALAQEGRRAPLLSGRYLLSAGIVYGLASLCAWLVASGALGVPLWWQGGVWILATAVYVPSVRLQRGACRRPGASSITNVASTTAWRALGYALLALFVATGLACWRERSAIVWDTFPCLVLCFYGSAWMIAATLSGMGWLRRIAGGCFLAAMVMGAVCDTLLVFPAFAAACFLLIALPGWLLLRAEPSDIV